MISLGRPLNLTASRQTPAATAPARVRSLYDLQEFLGRMHRYLRNGDSVPTVMDELISGIGDMRAHTGADGWKAAVEKIRRHPLTPLLHEDPFTHRGFHKPRGCAGDAVMLDYIYRDRLGDTPMNSATPLGAKICEYTTAMPIAQAMLNRRDIIALQIDHTAERTGDAEVLALQCGHLPEAALSTAVRNRALHRFIALDRDIHAVATVDKEWGRAAISTINTPTYALLSGAPNALGRFDLIYSANLFDELDVRSAVRAIAALFAMLKPGGRIWIANFLPGIRDAAYLEAFMNWWIVYRTTAALEGLLAGVPDKAIAERKTYIEPTDQIAFLEVVRSL